MVIYVKEVPGINLIFKKDNEGNYLPNSLLYQDILYYAIVLRTEHPENGYNNSFREREIAKWLLKHNREFLEYYRGISTRTTTYQNRIENRLPRIRDKLNDLIKIGLVEECGTTKALKNSDIITLYKYTLDGYLLSYLIESLDPTKQENADNEIYNLYTWYFEQFPSSTSPFSLMIYKKLKEGQVFGRLVDILRDVISKGTHINNMQEFFSAATLPQYLTDMTKENPTKLSGMLEKLIQEMDRQKRDLFFYDIKQDIETKMARKVDNIYEYIKLRHQIRYRIDIIALLGVCEDCKSVLPKAVNLLWYFTKIYCIPHMMMRANCSKCKKERSVIFPQL